MIVSSECKKPKLLPMGASVEIYPREFICNARQAIWLKLIKNSEDLDNDEIGFHPKFTHQLFEKEQIFGYRNLRINLYFAEGSLKTLLEITYDEIVSAPRAVNDVKSKIAKFLGKGYFTDRNLFIKELEIIKSFVPFGKTIESYRKITKSDNNPIYIIKKTTFKTPGFKEIHDRMQFFLLLFIDASSFIDPTDSIWKVLSLYERRENPKDNENGGKSYSYAFAGYCTLYSFYCFPNSSRLRISQILILPPYQRSGHGGQIMAIINSIAQNGQYKEINIEDPSGEFQFLRDLTDLVNCKRNGFFDFINDQNFAKELPKEVLESAQKKLRITETQVNRCFEVFKLDFLDISDKEKYKTYRIAVKKRIFKIFNEELSVLKPEDLKLRLGEIYFDVENRYSQLLLKLHKKPKKFFEVLKTGEEN